MNPVRMTFLFIEVILPLSLTELTSMFLSLKNSSKFSTIDTCRLLTAYISGVLPSKSEMFGSQSSTYKHVV